jgi:hypothetical protein
MTAGRRCQVAAVAPEDAACVGGRGGERGDIGVVLREAVRGPADGLSGGAVARGEDTIRSAVTGAPMPAIRSTYSARYHIELFVT